MANADELREFIEREVRAGYLDGDEIAEAAIEYFDGSDDVPDAEERGPTLVDEILGEHLRAQASWRGLTDCDRLDAAFAELESSRIVCRQNWTCCQSCGLAEIAEELKPASRGYVFFHQQDTEAAVEGGSLFLAYGACAEDGGVQKGVADEIARTIRENGLTVEWDGSLAKRMVVKLEWKKRRR